MLLGTVYLRSTSRRRKDGSVVRYLQLAHNEWDSEAGQAKAKLLYNFGREDALDRAAIGRLIASLARALEPGEALAAAAAPELCFLDSRPMGGAYLLDQLWRRLGIDATLGRLLSGRRLDPRAERVLFALVCNRALEPLSKLAATTWVAERVAIPELEELDDDACYRAMDFLLAVEPELAEAVYWATADLLNLEVDLLFFDTTSAYFELDEPDPAHDGETGFRSYGRSKDHRPDLPQVVVGLAVTRTGIPIRVWVWPGNRNDHELIRQVKDELRAWKLTRVVWVADRGFCSAENRRYLQRAGGHYIVGEKLRSDSKEAGAALARQGRYHVVAGNLRVKQVRIDDGTYRDRFVICHNPERAERDRAVREQILARLKEEIAGADRLTPAKRRELYGALSTKPAYKRFLRQTPTGKLRIDRSAVARERKLDGKFLLRTSDESLTPADLAQGYKALYEAERGWRDLKHTIDLRPAYHRRDDRIEAHVQLCWLALLLLRVAETETADTWRNIRNELDRIHLVTLATSEGTVSQRSELTPGHRHILKALQLPEPPRFYDFTPAAE